MSKLESYIWFERYRPSELKDLTLTKGYRASFKKFIEDSEIPHLIFEGPAGSGKTTMSRLLIDKIPSICLTLNASGKEDRSIETMQTKVRMFAGSKVPRGMIKIVFLDEADGMLKPAQESLKNLMEKYNKNCRFILTCNHVDKIISPLQSRCIRFTFDRFPKRKAIKVCSTILASEEIEATNEQLSSLVDRFYPDMRTIVNNLQAACLNGVFDESAIGSLNVDPAVVAEHIKSGFMLSIRKVCAGTTDFAFLYKYLYDQFLDTLDCDGDVLGEVLFAIGDSNRYDNSVPDRELEFMMCCSGIMTALDVTPNFNK